MPAYLPPGLPLTHCVAMLLPLVRAGMTGCAVCHAHHTVMLTYPGLRSPLCGHVASSCESWGVSQQVVWSRLDHMYLNSKL